MRVEMDIWMNGNLKTYSRELTPGILIIIVFYAQCSEMALQLKEYRTTTIILTFISLKRLMIKWH